MPMVETDIRNKIILKNLSTIIKLKRRLEPPNNKASKNSVTWNNYVTLAKSISIKNLYMPQKMRIKP